MTNDQDHIKQAGKEEAPAGRFTRIDSEPFYTIRNYDRLTPFLMSIVSDSDHWMFISSNGGLTAGRANPQQPIFPYDSEDKLHLCHDHTGPRTALWVTPADGEPVLWEPFRESAKDNYHINRNLYKSELGNRLIFEEVNHDLSLTFRYGWCYSERFGIVRDAVLANAGDRPIQVHMMDGLLNVIPPGITPLIHQQRHCLADAYKHSELDTATGLGIFSLSSMILDRPEPGETLFATTVWSTGLEDAPTVILDPAQLTPFRRQQPVTQERIFKGRKGAYLITTTLAVEPGQTRRWQIVTDTPQTQAQVVDTTTLLRPGQSLTDELLADCRNGSLNLRKNLASADALQETGSQLANAHHLANILFNNMRGGVFDHNHDVGRDDLARFIADRNRTVASRCQSFFDKLPDTSPVQAVIEKAQELDDADLIRLCYEYLPIYFSRRHGDPSRPWNFFDIRLRDEQGGRVLSYEGNWRDIFQNWEALCLSFPGFLPSVIAKFVNASTADGFNPYRITREGIDWEVVEPDDPWSNIGYWGDHQIVYLLKLLEALQKYSPDRITEMLGQDVFSYADVPYTIKPYETVVNNPYDTITYDRVRAKRVAERIDKLGADGRLLDSGQGDVYHVNLAEKLLVPALSKISNLVMGGGIWLNTQRPEWNDANNALVGNGLSVVTLCYLRRYLAFISRTLGQLPEAGAGISKEVAQWLEAVYAALNNHVRLLDTDTVSDTDRRSLLNALGEAFSEYRHVLYQNGLTGKTAVPREQVLRVIDLSLRFVDQSIRVNRRDDGMYHAYNLLEAAPDSDTAHVGHLYEMLEGQVAALSSGLLNDADVLTLLDAMRDSALYRPDQDSYILYPDRDLPVFLKKSVVPADRVQSSPLLMKLIEAQNTDLIYKDVQGGYRFNGKLYNVNQMAPILQELASDPKWAELVKSDAGRVREIYEEVFNHKSFTGRSGAMYGYEGLGCIYWHMVSKLLLAVQECHRKACDAGADSTTTDALADAYYRVRKGLGFNKTPAEYGAFPTDPYSHTPGFAGARQPGMTGQVKEEVITRFGELGLVVADGGIRFAPTLIRKSEFLRIESRFNYYDIHGEAGVIELSEGTVAFTFCQTPVVYRLSEGDTRITVALADGQTTDIQSDTLPEAIASQVFARSGQVARIEVAIPADSVIR